MDYVRAHSRRGSGEQPFPLAGLELAGPFADRDADFGCGFNLGTAKDDADALAGSASTVQPNDDVVDDAHISGGVLVGMAQRIAIVLGGIQSHRNRNPVLYHGLGAAIPSIPAPVRGAGRRWFR